MSASQDFSWVDKKVELSSTVYLAYLSAVSIDKKSADTRKKLKKDRRRSMPRCYRLCVLIGPGPRGGGSSLVHGLWRHPLVGVPGPHWSAVRWVLGGLVSSYLQAGLEKCPLEKMTPLKGAENSRLTAIPLFSQVTSNPDIIKSQSLCILLFLISFQRTISQSCNIST